MPKLTKRTIDSLKPGEKPWTAYDSELRGFFVRVMPSGKKTFGVRYGTRGRRRWMSVGEYGRLTVEEAREGARRKLAQADLGGDPAGERRRQLAVPTFKQWSDDYLEGKRFSRKRPRLIEMYLRLAAESIGSLPLNEIQTADVSGAFRRVSRRGKPVGNRFLTTVSACLASAVKRGLIPANPAANIERNRENPPRARVLSEDELQRLVAAVEAEKDVYVRAAFRLLLETGARLGEVLGARWEDLDLRGGWWRLPDPKAGKPQRIPLHAQTVAWLDELPRRGAYIVAGNDDSRPRADLKRPWERLKASLALIDVTIHDLRRTFGSLVAKEAGLHLASALLRHSSTAITEKAYAPLAEAQLREAQAKVIPFMRQAS